MEYFIIVPRIINYYIIVIVNVLRYFNTRVWVVFKLGVLALMAEGSLENNQRYSVTVLFSNYVLSTRQPYIDVIMIV